VEALEVADAKSEASIRTVLSPRNCESSAQPEPVAPPPITQTSKDLFWMSLSASARLFILESPACEKMFRE